MARRVFAGECQVQDEGLAGKIWTMGAMDVKEEDDLANLDVRELGVLCDGLGPRGSGAD